MRRLRLFVSLGLLAGVLPACGEQGPQTITDVRSRDTVRREVPEGMTAARRYGFRRQPAAGHGHGGAHGGAMVQQFRWTTPAGWTEKPRNPGSMRKGSWGIDDAPRADCSLIALGGSGGGLAANVNRWRGEMGLEPLDIKAIAELPRRKLLGRDAVYLNMTGTFGGGMGGGGPIQSARMLGLILALPQSMMFLKLTGPADAIEKHQGAFESLADSITFGAVPAGAGDAPKAGPDAAKGAAKGPAKPAGFLWATPDGWEEQPARMMRIVTFVPKDAPTAWCYASRLGGTAGGLAMNINRWRGEMGVTTPLDDAGVAKLKQIDMLGTKATLLDVEGSFSGTGGPPQKGARMLGVVCPRERDVVFIKMVGPPEAIAKHYDAFIAFCTSLQEDR